MAKLQDCLDAVAAVKAAVEAGQDEALPFKPGRGAQRTPIRRVRGLFGTFCLTLLSYFGRWWLV